MEQPAARGGWHAAVFGGTRHVPRTSYAAPSRWRPRLVTLLVLSMGLVLFGAGEGALVAAGLGVSPWTVLAQGLSVRTGLDIGVTSAFISLAVLLLWWPLGERPGLGTILNIAIISAVLGLTADRWPTPSSSVLALVQVLAGIAMVGLGGALYLSAHLGPGPRDGLMTGLHARYGVPVAGVRLGLEVAVLLVGWLLGGTVGVGTVLFALLIGRALAFWLSVVARLAPEVLDDPDLPEERGS
jgi:uncharacterized membrane protein YczE